MQPPKAPQTDSDKLRSATPSSRAEPRLETPDLAVRPSTSNGPEDHTTMFQKKANAAPSIYSQEQAPIFPAFPSFPNSTTTLSTSGEITEEQGVIGIALGSPTVGSHWNSTPQAADSDPNVQASDTEMIHFQQPDGSSAAVGNRQVAPKSKLSRWKSLFRKVPPAPPTPEQPAFYQLAQTVVAVAERADSHHDEESPDAQMPAQKEMGRSRKVLPPTYNPGIRASRRGAPEGFIVPKSPPEFPSTRERALTLGSPTSNPRSTMKIQRAFTSPLPPPRDKANGTPAVPKLTISGSKGNTGTPGSDAGSDERSLLDVSIPDVTMERYSVMFGNVLQSSPQRSSSLLQRRQANAEKLKPLNKLSVQEEVQDLSSNFKLPRRATSPAPSGSPRLTLFPTTTPSRAPSPLSGATKSGKVLHRSRTSPAKSPLRQTFAKAGENLKKSESSTNLLKPTTGSPCVKPAITPTSVHSFESDTESITILVGQTNPLLHLDSREPEWEICTKPTAITTDTATPAFLSRTDSQRQPKPTKLSALSSHPSSAPLDVPSPLHRLQSLTNPPLSADRIGAKRTASETRSQRKDVEVRSAATVGIARSVSVSKANSPRAMLPRGQADTKSPQGERLVERQVLTPTMVEVRNRKSQRVQLEMAA